MPQVINTVTKAAPTDNYPVVKDTDLSGSYRIVANITERDATVSNQRKQSMLVFVISDLHFYQLQADLLTWTDLGTSLGGGFAPPVVRYVYLVAEISDALRMGGSANNTYTTFQTAYNAANALQIALGASSYVVIRVGQTLLTQSTTGIQNTFTNSAGDLTLTANYNSRIVLSGDGVRTSVLGNIIATNAAGNGFNVGFGTRTYFVISNLTIGNISTNAVGNSGNSGTISIRANACQIGTLNTSIVSIPNTLGVAGNVSVSTNSGSTLSTLGGAVTSIITSAQGPLASAGTVNLSGVTVGNITGANNNLMPNSNAITLNDCTVSGTIFCYIANSVVNFNPFIVISNSTIVTINASLPGTSTIGSVKEPNRITNSVVSGDTTIIHNGLTAEPVILTTQNSTFNKFTTNASVQTLASLCTFEGLYNGGFVASLVNNIGDNSVFNSCSFICVNLTESVIKDIGTGCSLINCGFSIQGVGGNKAGFSILNTSLVSVNIINTKLAVGRFGVSYGVTLVKSPVVVLADGGGFQYTWDTSANNQASATLNGGAGGNTLILSNLTIGETYYINVENGNGDDSVIITDDTFALLVGIAQAGSTGGEYTLTPIIGAVDRLLITFDGTTIWVSSAGQDFKF